MTNLMKEFVKGVINHLKDIPLEQRVSEISGAIIKIKMNKGNFSADDYDCILKDLQKFKDETQTKLEDVQKQQAQPKVDSVAFGDAIHKRALELRSKRDLSTVKERPQITMAELLAKRAKDAQSKK